MGRNGEATRLALLEAGGRLWGCEGLIVAVNRIVSEAGCKNPSAVRFHFGGRDGLLDAVIEHLATPFETDVATRLAAGVSEVRAVVESLADDTAVPRDLPPVLAQVIADPTIDRERWDPHLPVVLQALSVASRSAGAEERVDALILSAMVMLVQRIAESQREPDGRGRVDVDGLVTDIERFLGAAPD